MLNHHITDDREKEGTHYHKNIGKMDEEPIHTCDDTQFTQGEIKQMIENVKGKKAPAIDGITSGIFLRTFNTFPRLVTSINNQYLKRGCFPRRWKTAKIIPIKNPAKKRVGIHPNVAQLACSTLEERY